MCEVHCYVPASCSRLQPGLLPSGGLLVWRRHSTDSVGDNDANVIACTRASLFEHTHTRTHAHRHEHLYSRTRVSLPIHPVSHEKTNSRADAGRE